MSRVLVSYAADLEWTKLKSSNVEAVAYQDDFTRLYVKFKSGGRYAYEGVPKRVYYQMIAAPSAGGYLDRVIKKGGYAYSGPF